MQPNKYIYIYFKRYSENIFKKNEIMPFATTWMDILSKSSQGEKDK